MNTSTGCCLVNEQSHVRLTVSQPLVRRSVRSLMCRLGGCRLTVVRSPVCVPACLHFYLLRNITKTRNVCARKLTVIPPPPPFPWPKNANVHIRSCITSLLRPRAQLACLAACSLAGRGCLGFVGAVANAPAKCT